MGGRTASVVVYKLSPQGRLLLVLGKKGTPGEFHFANKTLNLFTEPNGVAIAPNGEIYVAHTLNWRAQKFVRK